MLTLLTRCLQGTGVAHIQERAAQGKDAVEEGDLKGHDQQGQNHGLGRDKVLVTGVGSYGQLGVAIGGDGP